jgi:N-dimethylarginine dimethylaminohydrolase
MGASMPKINKLVLMSDANYFSDKDAINALYDSVADVDLNRAIKEHEAIKKAFTSAGIEVRQVPSPPNCQDGVYAANWGLTRGGKILMSRLPNKRKPEETYALEVVKNLGLTPLFLPETVKSFSGQGDALPCGETVFTQSPFRTSREAHPFIKDLLGYKEVVSLNTKPLRWFKFGPTKRNKLTGWPDSPTYDLDLALAVLKWPEDGQKGLIAYCPKAFRFKSRRWLKRYNKVDKITVSKKEAHKAFALNLVSTGEVVIMPSGAPVFQAAIEAHGLKTTTINLVELQKGGGSIRCSSLTLDN